MFERRQSTSIHTLMFCAGTILSPRLSGTKKNLVWKRVSFIIMKNNIFVDSGSL